MTDARLKRTEKNDVLLLIEQFGFDPSEFEWADEDVDERQYRREYYGRISVLRHQPTEFFCKFGLIRITYSPGFRFRVENQEHQGIWSAKLSFARTWLAELRKQVDAPDLWATIGQEKALSTAISSASLDNRPFTAAEQSLIVTKLDEIKAYLLEGQQFAVDQAETIEREFAYLKESSRRLGRKDWLNVLYGGLITVIVGVALAPDAARSLLRLAAAAFQSLLGMAQGLIQ